MSIVMPVVPKVEEKPVVETKVEEKPAEESKTEDIKKVESKIEPFKDKIPSNWIIEPLDENDLISARNIISGEVFKGTISEFNKALRG